jgi:hypothetical protein
MKQPNPKQDSEWIVTNVLGSRTFRLENDAYDYAIRIIQQTGFKSKIMIVDNNS